MIINLLENKIHITLLKIADIIGQFLWSVSVHFEKTEWRNRYKLRKLKLRLRLRLGKIDLVGLILIRLPPETRRMTSPSNMLSVATGRWCPCCSMAATGITSGVCGARALISGHVRSVQFMYRFLMMCIEKTSKR